MECNNPALGKYLIRVDGYAEKRDPTIYSTLDEFFTDSEMIADVLRYWPEMYHFGALLYLRHRGYEAWAMEEENYRYKAPGWKDFVKIVPLHKRDLVKLNRMIENFVNKPSSST
jgi:hypothetical protein